MLYQNNIRTAKEDPAGSILSSESPADRRTETEFYEFLKKRGKEVEATTMYSEVWRYDAVSAFLAKRAKRVQSLQEREPEVWLRQLRAWMLEEGYRLTVAAVSEYTLRYTAVHGDPLLPDGDLRQEPGR